MTHLSPFQPRETIALRPQQANGWTLKRYAILARGRGVDDAVVEAASVAAVVRLPEAGTLADEDGNHGVGFQIVHFAQVAVVAPVFYWQWGSVLANAQQLRAPWDDPTRFEDGVADVVGCVWEMHVVREEVAAWQAMMLSADGTPAQRLDRYVRHIISA